MSENDINMQDKDNDIATESSNIFDDFSADYSLLEDIKKSKEEEKKDWFYYLSVAWKVFQVLFIILLLVCILWYIYIYIQKNEWIKDSSMLDPICFIIKDEKIANPTTYCSSISYVKKYYETELLTLKAKQTEWILENLVDIYENENFLSSKDVTFLKNKAKERLNMINVLEEFDSLKKAFLWLEKNKIQCGEWFINADEGIMEISCNAYSQSYENNWIVWFSWDPAKTEEFVSGTSLSIANSFLNYIEKTAKFFTIYDRQKLFESEDILDTTELWITSWFTKKTSFTVKLKINL